MVRFPVRPRHLISPPKSIHPNDNSKTNFTSLIKQQCLHLLKRCSSLKQLSQINAIIHTSGLHQDADITSQILINGNSNKTGLFFDHFGGSIANLPTYWNNLIRSYITQNSPREAVLIFRSMRRKGVMPNNFTYPVIFKACGSIRDLEGGKQIQGDVIKHGLDGNIYVQNTLILFYGSCGEIICASQVFDEMRLRTIVTWNSMISACVDNSHYRAAIEIAFKMRGCDEVKPDETTMVLLLSACVKLGSLRLGKWSHGQVVEKGLTVNCHLGTALVDMYAKCGSLDYARRVFDRMHERNEWTWTAMISGLAQHGFAKEALELFSIMKAENLPVNNVTFLGVLCACSHGGLVDEGYRIFHEMEHVYGIKPTVTHYGAMVDMLGRAGLVKEAYSFIMNMQAKPDAVVWRTLLSACNIHSSDDQDGVGEEAQMILLGLEPKRTGNLVLMSNMCAEVGRWEGVVTLKKLMKKGGLKKIAGESFIEIGRSICKFKPGYHHSVEYEGMYSLLDGLNLHMKTINSELEG